MVAEALQGKLTLCAGCNSQRLFNATTRSGQQLQVSEPAKRCGVGNAAFTTNRHNEIPVARAGSDRVCHKPVMRTVACCRASGVVLRDDTDIFGTSKPSPTANVGNRQGNRCHCATSGRKLFLGAPCRHQVGWSSQRTAASPPVCISEAVECLIRRRHAVTVKIG